MIRANPKKYLKSMTKDFAEKVSAVFHTIAGKLFWGQIIYFSQVLMPVDFSRTALEILRINSATLRFYSVPCFFASFICYRLC